MAQLKSKIDYEYSLFRLVRSAWRERKPREKNSRAKSSGRGARERISRGHFVLAIFFRVTQFVVWKICISFKTNNATQEGRLCHRIVLFPVIWRHCSADVKIFVDSFTFATQKLTKKTPKHFADSSSCQHLSKLAYLFTVYIWDSRTSKHAVSILWFDNFYLAVNVTLIAN